MSEFAIVGTCGNCGGFVSLPAVWHSVVPPVPTCQKCGSTVKSNLPKLPMNPPPKQVVKEDIMGAARKSYINKRRPTPL